MGSGFGRVDSSSIMTPDKLGQLGRVSQVERPDTEVPPLPNLPPMKAQVGGQLHLNEANAESTQEMGPNPIEAQPDVIPNTDITVVPSTISAQLKSPLRPSNYIKAYHNPSDENIKTLNYGIGIDLSKASLRLIRNTWNLITDEAWELITSGQIIKDLHNPPREKTARTKGRENTQDTNPEKTLDEQPPPPKPRGIPRKNTPPDTSSNMAKHVNKQKPTGRTQRSTRGRKKEMEIEENLSLTTVPITLSHRMHLTLHRDSSNQSRSKLELLRGKR
ncbi:hypothetical protein J5N97_024412 [Dioscorea zingiberensis]|uniref:Uncharacterized protein n=1 Tax=Dioscorea zingiberensis TaxID=325984 RepID=A0A9D5C7B9_9LILI|nr:hypothetical protein J5N97_024412 [Dioscorea zingiberensis]